MKSKKKEIVLIALGLLLVVSITIGISYAWWTSRVEQGSINKINSDCLKLQLVDETGAIQLEKAYPLTDTEASFLTPYQFKIENTCNTSVVYDVGLEILESENRLSSEYIAIEVNNGEKKLLNTLPEIEPSIKKEEENGIEGRYIAHGELGGKESISYRIKVWMNEDVTIEDDAMNKTWKSKIVVNASLNQIVEVYQEDILNGADPVLAEELIPVKISETGEVTKANIYEEWYNYEKKEWANAVILEDESITYKEHDVIPESNIESYFVWIPKYSYKLWDLGNYSGITALDTTKPHEIAIKFGLTNTSDSVEGECTTPMNEEKSQGLSGSSGNCKVGDYMTPPAFISMGTNGLWVGKFETGYKGATSSASAQVNTSDATKVEIKPNVYSWRSIQIINAYQTSYNYKREMDSHMMKNTEWGAVAYLQHSKYGSATKVRINNNSAFVTGYAGTEEPTLGYNVGTSIAGNRNENKAPYTDGTYTKNYLNPESQVASTTGNYSGIYDMSGGAWEYVMGVRSSISSGNGGISGNIETKYYDLYGASPNNSSYQYRILGDGTSEFGPFWSKKDPDNAIRYKSSWYNDYAHFVQFSASWFGRGTNYHHGVDSGVFAFGHHSGAADPSLSFRIVLAI